MKSTLLLVLVLMLSEICTGEKMFYIACSVEKTEITVNGIKYSIDSTGSKIPTNFPKFDTLVFVAEFPERPGFNRSIICNFRPDSSYTIQEACCRSFDIIPSSKLKNDSLNIWDYDEDFNKIQNQLMDKPFISIRTVHPPKDSIFAWHADISCFSENRHVDTTLWELGVPIKCYFWNNITTIVFYKTDDNLPDHEETVMEEFLGKDNIVELKEITFRLFDNERYVMTFDEESNTIKLEYVESPYTGNQ